MTPMPDPKKLMRQRKDMPMRHMVMDTAADQMMEYARIMDDPRFSAEERARARKMAQELSRKAVRRRG